MRTWNGGSRRSAHKPARSGHQQGRFSRDSSESSELQPFHLQRANGDWSGARICARSQLPEYHADCLNVKRFPATASPKGILRSIQGVEPLEISPGSFMPKRCMRGAGIFARGDAEREAGDHPGGHGINGGWPQQH